MAAHSHTLVLIIVLANLSLSQFCYRPALLPVTGMFMIEIRMYNRKGEVVQTSARAVSVRSFTCFTVM